MDRHSPTRYTVDLDDETTAQLVRYALIKEGSARAANLCAARLLADALKEALPRAEALRRAQRSLQLHNATSADVRPIGIKPQRRDE